jgi:hypothetical protein
MPRRLQLHRGCPREIEITKAIGEIKLAIATGRIE